MAYKDKEAAAAWRREWRARNKERLAEKARAWRAANREHYLALKRAARQTPESIATTQAYLERTKETRAEQQRERDRIRRADPANKASIAAKRKQYRSLPSTKQKEQAYSQQYKKAARDRLTALENKRRARKANAVPSWYSELDELIMLEAADLCNRRRITTGFAWQIDHIVPLLSKQVCGLHIGCNIQVIPAVENQSKGNRYWPDMP